MNSKLIKNVKDQAISDEATKEGNYCPKGTKITINY